MLSLQELSDHQVSYTIVHHTASFGAHLQAITQPETLMLYAAMPQETSFISHIIRVKSITLIIMAPHSHFFLAAHHQHIQIWHVIVQEPMYMRHRPIHPRAVYITRPTLVLLGLASIQANVYPLSAQIQTMVPPHSQENMAQTKWFKPPIVAQLGKQ